MLMYPSGVKPYKLSFAKGVLRDEKIARIRFSTFDPDGLGPPHLYEYIKA